MSKYEVNVVNIIDNHGESATGTIEVQPPFVVGEGFKNVILGKEQDNIHMDHIHTTDVATTFTVESSTYDIQTHELLIRRVGTRISELLNGEKNAATMRAENPFPRP